MRALPAPPWPHLDQSHLPGPSCQIRSHPELWGHDSVPNSSEAHLLGNSSAMQPSGEAVPVTAGPSKLSRISDL